MKVAVNEGFRVIVSNVEHASISIEGFDSEVDLSKNCARLVVESAILSFAFLSDQLVETL